MLATIHHRVNYPSAIMNQTPNRRESLKTVNMPQLSAMESVKSTPNPQLPPQIPVLATGSLVNAPIPIVTGASSGTAYYRQSSLELANAPNIPLIQHNYHSGTVCGGNAFNHTRSTSLKSPSRMLSVYDGTQQTPSQTTLYQAGCSSSKGSTQHLLAPLAAPAAFNIPGQRIVYGTSR
eukprot:Filipodium_phascolosomae@DN2501_c0_g1_i1.p1